MITDFVDYNPHYRRDFASWRAQIHLQMTIFDRNFNRMYEQEPARVWTFHEYSATVRELMEILGDIMSFQASITHQQSLGIPDV